MKQRPSLYRSLPPVPPAVNTIVSTVLLWTAISALGALQTYSDNLRGGVGSHYPALLVTWFIEYAVPLIVLSAGLSIALARWPAVIERPRNVVALFVGLVLVFQPAQWLYMAWLRGYLHIASLDDLWQLLLKMLLVGWFSTTGTFAAILAINYWRQAQGPRAGLAALADRHAEPAPGAGGAAHAGLARAARTALPVQRAERDQRAGARRRQALALGGIGRLSDLLRYALSASVRNTATVAAELQFVRDYLDLQRLRYGERLQVAHRRRRRPFLHDVDCPPLLLQPLIENALRHDLDCREGPSDIRLRFAQRRVMCDPRHQPGQRAGVAESRHRARAWPTRATGCG
jgi:two-component system sensor histidine kinase AlgZ